MILNDVSGSLGPQEPTGGPGTKRMEEEEWGRRIRRLRSTPDCCSQSTLDGSILMTDHQTLVGLYAAIQPTRRQAHACPRVICVCRPDHPGLGQPAVPQTPPKAQQGPVSEAAPGPLPPAPRRPLPQHPQGTLPRPLRCRGSPPSGGHM